MKPSDGIGTAKVCELYLLNALPDTMEVELWDKSWGPVPVRLARNFIETSSRAFAGRAALGGDDVPLSASCIGLALEGTGFAFGRLTRPGGEPVLQLSAAAVLEVSLQCFSRW